MRVWKLNYGTHGGMLSHAYAVGCMCGDGHQHYHPWGIDVPPTHVQDSRGEIYPFDPARNHHTGYAESWKPEASPESANVNTKEG